MPFKKHAKITIENQHPADIGGFFYQIDYNLKEVPENAGYFYAQWRREPLTIKAEDYTILDNVSGRGQYIGTYVGIAALERYWWGEGEMNFTLMEMWNILRSVVQERKIISEVHGAMPDLKMENSRNRIFVLRL